MKIKVFSIMIVVFLVLAGLIGVFDFDNTTHTAVAKTWYVGGTGGNNYTRIQDAIDNASTGDTVFVYSGIYKELLVVNKSIELVGEGMSSTIIYGNYTGNSNSTYPPHNQTQDLTDDVIYVNASNVLIKGFTVTNGSSDFWYAGIKLENVKNCTIMNNNVSANKQNGIMLYQCSNITVKNNYISNNGNAGIYSYVSNNNTITNNTMFKNMLFLSTSKYNIVEDNEINGSGNDYNKYGMHILYSSNENIIKNNKIMNCVGSGIAVLYSYDNNVSNNQISHCAQTSSTTGGILIQYSHENIFYNNKIIRNVYSGILFQNSNNNIIVFNKIYDNKIGLHRGTSDHGNKLYLNELVNNSHNTLGVITYRDWNSSLPMGYIYNNTNFTNYLGNYWDDYTGSDLNGDGIGDTPYNIGTQANFSEKDFYPLMKPVENYIIIPTSIKADLTAGVSNSTNVTVGLNLKNAVIHASVKGVLNGSVRLMGLQFVTITSGYFAGKGFFIGNWTAKIEGTDYQGKWHGMLFNNSGESKIYLKGTLSGGLTGLTDGYLIESSKGSGKFDLYNSTWTLNQVDHNLVFAELTVNGTVKYQSAKNFTSEVYILQISCKGNTSGYYNGSLDVVLTHVRINNESNKYHGQGFSFVTYTSTYGTGQGWTYDRSVSKGITKLTGFFTEPLWGLVFGKIDETGATVKLTLSIVRIDIGLPPRAIVSIDVWSWHWVSPGQTVNYLLSIQNYGLKSTNNTEVILKLPNKVTYRSSTCNGTYQASTHTVTWKFNIPAKSKKVMSVKCKINWGLSQGTKLLFKGIIHDYLTNATLAEGSHTSVIRVAWDPNVKYGPEGNVSASQKLNYTIEFENLGEGIAFGVYFTDELSIYLNDSSLDIGPVRSTKDNSTIAPPGKYNPDTRTITWLVGEVGPKEGGFANISIQIIDYAATGTEIINYATVYFPSVPEVTKTNGIISVVNMNQRPIADAGPDRVVKTFENIVFDGSASTDVDGFIVNYTWDFGDGQFGYGVTTSHSYSENGNYKVKLTVEDDLGELDTYEINVLVNNRRPTAVLEADITELFTGYQVTFNAAQSTDLDGSVIDYRIDFGDGSNSGWVQSSSIKHQYTDGTVVYTSKLTVRDDDGGISINVAELEILVKNRAPDAALSTDKLEWFTYEDATFSAESSTDPDGVISSYYFDFGDGEYSAWGSKASVSHQYTDGTKEYTVQVLVKDDDGETDSTEITIKINNRAPEANAGPDRVVDTNEVITFDGKASTDLDGNIKSYSWNFGDGSSTSTGKTTTHSYPANGQYTVTLTITDDDGAVGKDTCIVTVNNRPPLAGFTVTPETGDINTVFEFSSTSTDDDGTITNFYWDFGDGLTSAEMNPTHQFKARGKYIISLKVQDDDGSESEIFEKEITINNIKPVAAASSSVESAEVGESVTFDASGSYDPDGTITKFNWQFGDDKTNTGKVVQHIYSSKGVYTVTLTITDDASELTTTTLSIEITEPVPDFDSDGIPDHLDPDDDNDGITDVWEENYGFNPKNAADAALDPDNDDLNNLEEFGNGTEPKNPDTDGEGLLDGEELKVFKTDPKNVDTDGDKLDDYNDPYPTDPTRPRKDDGDEEVGWIDYQAFAILGVIIILIIIITLALVLRKRRSGGQAQVQELEQEQVDIGTPYDKDEILRAVRDEILADTSRQNLLMSRDNIKSKLDSSQDEGEISEETYKYINEQILKEEAETEE